MSSDYTDILNRARKEIPEPVDVPTGTWRLEVVAGKYVETPDDGEIMAEGMITYKLVEAGEDVDEEAYAEFAEDSMASARIFDRFWIRDLRDIQKLNRLFDMMGVDGSLSIKEAVKASKGYQIMGYVFQKPDSKDPDVMHTNVKQFTPVED